MFLDLLWSHLDLTWVLTGLVGLLTFVLVRHMLIVRSLPPGPFPLPVLGNMLSLSLASSSDLNVTMREWTSKYGNVFTMWMGPTPTIVCSGWENCKDALITKRNDFSGRIKRHLMNVLLDGSDDVLLGDYGPCWETLRKILSLAVRKYSVSQKLADLVVDIVDEVVELMVNEGKAVDANDYTYLALYSVLASSTFGRRYGPKDPEFVALRTSNDKLNDCFEEALILDFLPILRLFYRKQDKKLRDNCEDFRSHFIKHYKEHQETYTKGVVRDFTDAVIAARDEAQEESKDSAQYLTDQNIIGLMIDLFGAGTETTRLTINWLLLYACNFPETQERMQKEIDQNIGSRDPVQSDRDSCPYIQAAITEILRVRPVIDLTLEHKAICDTEIGTHKVKNGTSVLFNIVSCHKDPSMWPDPEEFKPERFLDSEGRFNNARLVGYMPFGLGRRSCPGEKLGLADVFLIFVRLLQKCTFQLENGPGSVDLQPKLVAFANQTHPYKLLVRRRNQM